MLRIHPLFWRMYNLDTYFFRDGVTQIAPQVDIRPNDELDNSIGLMLVRPIQVSIDLEFDQLIC